MTCHVRPLFLPSSSPAFSAQGLWLIAHSVLVVLAPCRMAENSDCRATEGSGPYAMCHEPLFLDCLVVIRKKAFQANISQGMFHELRVGGHAINDAPGVGFTDFFDLGCVDENFHTSFPSFPLRG